VDDALLSDSGPQRGPAFCHEVPEALERERIVRAAGELIAERGTGCTTLEDLSAATGASMHRLHAHFGDDHGPLEAVVEDDNRLICASADLDALATITLSAIQGGLLLTKTSRDVSPLRSALAGAIAEVRAHRPTGGSRRR
jgi:AcrR family transcriptional regulator